MGLAGFPGSSAGLGFPHCLLRKATGRRGLSVKGFSDKPALRRTPTFWECGSDPHPGLLMPVKWQAWWILPWLDRGLISQDSLQSLGGKPEANVEVKHLALRYFDKLGIQLHVFVHSSQATRHFDQL